MLERGFLTRHIKIETGSDVTVCDRTALGGMVIF